MRCDAQAQRDHDCLLALTAAWVLTPDLVCGRVVRSRIEHTKTCEGIPDYPPRPTVCPKKQPLYFL